MSKTTTHDHNPSRYIIQILVDQASPEAFFGWMDKGIAPHISKYILGEKTAQGTYSKATICRNLITGYPSTSANSHTSIITGSYAGKNNLLYTTFWNVRAKKPEYVNTEKISLSGLKDMNRKHINPACKTLFEYMDDSASFHAIHRGATYKLLTLRSIIFKFLPLLLKVKRSHGSEGEEPTALPQFWKKLFEDNIISYLTRIQEKAEMPEATFIVYLFSDSMGHKYGFQSEEYRTAIELLDYFIQCIVEGMEDKKGNHIPGVKELGYLDSIIWNFCTDHAARPVERDKFVMVNSLARIDLGLDLIDGENDNLKKILKRVKKNYAQINGFSNVGGELWHGWFGGPYGTSREDFARFYGENYFRNLQPKLKDAKETVDLIEHLSSQDYIQFVIIPEEEEPFENLSSISSQERIKKLIPREYTIKIIDSEGIGIWTRKAEYNLVHYAYELVRGKDPLHYETTGLDYGQFYPQTQWLEKTYPHDLPDIPHRLFGFFDCIYAPNFVATSAYSYHFLSTYKFAHTKEKMLKDFQTHDGLFREQSAVPLTLAGPGIKKGFELPYGRNIDILPTLLKALGKPFEEKKIDGKVLTEVLE